MIANLNYFASFGKLDGSGPLDWEVDLSDEEAVIYEEAIKLRKPFEEYPALEKPLERAYDEILEHELELFKEGGEKYWGDTYTECAGEYPVDEDELTELVHNRDEHALEFLHLTGLSNEELDSWDASDLDELPNVCDFDPNFEFKNPYEWYWDINVRYAKNPEHVKLGKTEATETLKALFEKAMNDYTEIKEYLSRCDDLYTGKDLTKLAADIAKKTGNEDFVLSLPFQYLPSEKITQDMCKEAVEQNPFNIQYVPKKYLTKDLCEVAVNGDSRCFSEIPDEFKTSEMCQNVLNNTRALFVPELFRSIPKHLLTKEICLKYIQSAYESDITEEDVSRIPEEFKDRSFYNAVVSKNFGKLFKTVPQEHIDLDLCFTYIKAGGELKNVPEQYKTLELCVEAIIRSSFAFKDVPESVVDSKLCLIAVSKHYSLLKDVPQKLITKEMCWAALRNSRYAFDYIPHDLLDEDMCMEYIRTGRANYSFYNRIPEEFLNQDLCLEMLKHDPFCFLSIPEQYRNEECCLLAIEHSPGHIYRIPEKLKTKEFYEKAKKVNPEVVIPDE